MKRFFRKRWVQTVSVILASVLLCSFVGIATSGFTNFDSEEIFSVKLNEENYFYNRIEDGDLCVAATYSGKAENGIISFTGTINDHDPNSVDIAKSVQIASIPLEAGTYTFTCFDDEKPEWTTYIAVATYTVDGTKYTAYADYKTAPNNVAKDPTKLGMTFTLEEATTVTFRIQLMEGANLKNVKAVPVLVDGDKPGSYSLSFFNIFK